MARKKKKVTERSSETKFAKKIFVLSIPHTIKAKKEVIPLPEKTSLFVPKEHLINEENGFEKSIFSGEVLVSRDIKKVLKTVFTHGNIAKRYGEGGLEQDPARQQIIVYTMVTCQKHLLWYQRAELTTKKDEVIVEPRLQGRFSVGFGGHKTRDDIDLGREELFFLRDLLPGIEGEISTLIGINKGLFSEVEEEIGLSRDQIKNLTILGAFYDARFLDPLDKIQVEWAHTAIGAVIEIEPLFTNHLTFRLSEIKKAWWIPFEGVEKEFETRMLDWIEGKGPRVERWSEVLIKEFWQDYLSSLNKK